MGFAQWREYIWENDYNTGQTRLYWYVTLRNATLLAGINLITHHTVCEMHKSPSAKCTQSKNTMKGLYISDRSVQFVYNEQRPATAVCNCSVWSFSSHCLLLPPWVRWGISVGLVWVPGHPGRSNCPRRQRDLKVMKHDTVSIYKTTIIPTWTIIHQSKISDKHIETLD